MMAITVVSHSSLLMQLPLPIAMYQCLQNGKTVHWLKALFHYCLKYRPNTSPSFQNSPHSIWFGLLKLPTHKIVKQPIFVILEICQPTCLQCHKLSENGVRKPVITDDYSHVVVTKRCKSQHLSLGYIWSCHATS